MTTDPNQGNPTGPPALRNVRVFQVDIIVKDTASAPKTGWVFTTLVHDDRVPGDSWDKLIPLGAMWGNDPNATKALALAETVINPKAPGYAKQTLGWGDRLSGPNDGAIVAPASINSQVLPAVRASSCMSCHGTAEDQLLSFLLPSPTPPPPGKPGEASFDGNVMKLDPPGGAAWNQWFQDRSGTNPQDPGAVALDYDLVLAFKSIPAWNTRKNRTMAGTLIRRSGRPRLYQGK